MLDVNSGAVHVVDDIGYDVIPYLEQDGETPASIRDSLEGKYPEEEIKAAVESMVYEDMVVTSIAEKEKITVSDDEYTQYVENNLDTYGMSSVEEFESTYSKESVMDELLREKVQKFLLDNAKVTEVSEDEYYQEYDEGETYSDEDVVDLSLDDEAETESVDADTESATEAASETGSEA